MSGGLERGKYQLPGMKAPRSYGDGPGRPKDVPSDAAFRKIAVLIDLVRHQAIRTDKYLQEYQTNERTLQRDLSQLRSIGDVLGFSISPIKGGRVELTSFDRRPRRLDAARKQADQLLAGLGQAFGEPMQRELGALAENADPSSSFIRFQSPVVLQGSHVANITDALREAMQSPAGPSKVRFRYRKGDGTTEERVVEPAHVAVRSGRYYLIAYDTGRKDWRVFGLDAFEGLPSRAGTLNAVRAVPPEYDSDDAIGFIKGGRQTAVTVDVSAAVAPSVTSRRWQRDQTIELQPDGRARVVFTVGDIAEVVRWAFGLAPEATIVAPPEAVQLAARFASELAVRHQGVSNDAKAP